MKMDFKQVHVVQTLFLVISILLGVMMLQPLRIQIDRRAEIMRNRIISQLEDSLGVKVSYESVSPALLSAVIVHDLNVAFDQGYFRAEIVRIYYNTFRFLTSDDRLISKIAIKNGHLDLAVSSNSLQENVRLNKEIVNAWSLFANRTVELSGISAEVRLNETIRLNAEDVNLTLNDERGIVRYGIAGVFRMKDTGSLKGIGEIRAEAYSDGSFSPSDSTVHGRFDILSAASNYVVLKPMSVDFTYAENRLSARRIGDNIPIDVLINYSSDGWYISGETENLKMENIAFLTETKLWFAPFFSSVVDGSFQISGSPAFDRFAYETDMVFLTESDIRMRKVESRFRGSQSVLYVDKLRVSSEWGSFSYDGILNIEHLGFDGLLTFNLDESLLGYPAFAKFNLNTRAGVIAAEPEEFELHGVQFRDFRFLVLREDDSFVLSLLAIPEGKEDSQEKKLTMDILVDSRLDLGIRGFVNVKRFEASSITRLLGLTGEFDPPFIRDFLLNMSASFELDSRTWSVSLDEVELVHKDNQNNGLYISGRASPENWSLNSLKAIWNEYVVDGRGFGKRLAEGGLAEGRVLFGEQIYQLSAKWSDDRGMILSSDFGLAAYMGPKSARGRSISLISDSVSIPLSDGRMVASIDVRGLVPTSGDWEIYINRTRFLLAGRSEKSDVSVALNGKLAHGSVVIPELSISDNYGELTGSAMLEAANNLQVLLGRLSLDGFADESYQLTLGRDGDLWDVALDISAANIGRIMPGSFSGELFTKCNLRGDFSNPSISLVLDSRNGMFEGRPFEVQGALLLESGLIRINDIQYSYNGIDLSRGLVLLNMREGSLKSTAELNATYNQVPVSSAFSLAIDFDEAFGIAEIPYLFDSNYKGTIATLPIMWDSTPHLPAYTFHFSKDDDFFRITSPSSEMLNLSYAYENGELDLYLGSKMPIVSTGSGTIKDGSIDLSLSKLDIDPVLINYVMYRDPILLQYYAVFQSGRLVGELDIVGSLDNPELYGILRAIDLKIDTPYTYAEIQPVSTDIHFEDHKIIIDRFDIPVGNGILYGGGSIVLDKFRIVECDMFYGATSTPEGAGVPVYYPLMGVNLDGIFTGEVHMRGGNKRFYLDGDFTFPKLRVTLGNPKTPEDQNRSNRYPGAVFLDFNFITGNNCIFYLPDEELRVIWAIAEIGQSVNLVFSNEPYNLSFTGVLPIRTGDIFYFDRDFRITEGSLSFNESFRQFNPTLSLRAETRVKDERGEDVQVALVYNAPILSYFNPTIETVPARSDVLSLFGQAVAPYSDSQDNRRAGRVLLATSRVFGQMGIVQPFEEALQEGLNLDMVSIRTDIIGNTLAEGLTRDANSELATQSQSLGRLLDNTSMYVGKYIGNSLFLSGTISADYPEIQRIDSVFGGLEFQTSVDLEMITPFFSVLWSYSPDFQGSTKFVIDNEITLKWRFSY